MRWVKVGVRGGERLKTSVRRFGWHGMVRRKGEGSEQGGVERSISLTYGTFGPSIVERRSISERPMVPEMVPGEVGQWVKEHWPTRAPSSYLLGIPDRVLTFLLNEVLDFSHERLH
jgi:hypothetical protein